MPNSLRPTVTGSCTNLGVIQTRRDLREKLGSCNYCVDTTVTHTTEVTGGQLAFRICDDCLIKLAESADGLRKDRKIAKIRLKNREAMLDYLRSGGELFDANPDCEHEMDQKNLNGIRCSKCSGWFCC